jgi:hypothetical protein
MVVAQLAKLKQGFSVNKEESKTEMFVLRFVELDHLTMEIILAMMEITLMEMDVQLIVFWSLDGHVLEELMQLMMFVQRFVEMVG